MTERNTYFGAFFNNQVNLPGVINYANSHNLRAVVFYFMYFKRSAAHINWFADNGLGRTSVNGT